MARHLWILGLATAGLAGCQPPLSLPASGPDRQPPATFEVIDAASEPARLSVALEPGARGIQALPASWDTATLVLTHPTALRAARTVTLAKGVQLIANGSGGYTATGTFGLLPPATGYTLTVSLWNGGAAGTLAGEKQVSLDLVGGPNAVTLPIEVYPALGLSGYTPAYGFPGDTVTLQGQGFSVLKSQDLLSLGGTSVPVTAASSVSMTTTVPALSQSVASWQLQVGSSLAGRTGFSLLGLLGSALGWVSLASSQQLPAMTVGNGEYFVTWQDDRLGATDLGIYGRRLGPDGSLLGSEVVVANAAGHQRYPDVAYNSAVGQYGVVYEDAAGSGDVRGQIVNANGTLSGVSFGLATGTFPQLKPRVTFNPASSQYAVVWTEDRNGNREVYGERFSATGTVVGGAALIDGGAGAQENPAIASDPVTGTMLIAWEDDSSGVRHVQGLVSSSTATLIAGPFDLTPAATSPQTAPQVALDASTGEFLVAWVSNGQQVLAQRVTTAGALSGSSFVLAGGTSGKSAPRLAYQAYRQKFLVCWSDDRNGNLDVYGQYAGSDGTLWGGPFAVATGAGDQGPSAVAADPSSKLSLVAYQDSANGGDLKGQRIR